MTSSVGNDPSWHDLEQAFLRAKRSNELDGHFLFSIKQRWLYFPIPKAANSTIKYIMSRAALPEKLSAKEASLAEDQRLVHSAKFGVLLTPYHFRPGGEAVLQSICTDPDVFRFTVVRNPYSRILSAYLDRYLSKSILYRSMFNVARKYDFPMDETEPLSFADFVKLIGLSQSPRELNQHVRSQVDQCHSNVLDYSFVGKFEQFNADMTYILEEIGAPSACLDLLTQNKSPAATKAGSRLAEFYDAETARLVRTYYHADFEAFGYDGALP